MASQFPYLHHTVNENCAVELNSIKFLNLATEGNLRKNIVAAMQIIQRNTCVRFIEDNSAKDFVEITAKEYK